MTGDTRAGWVRRLFEEGWNRRSFEFLENNIAPVVPFHYNGSTTDVTPDSLPGLVDMWRRAFPDLEMTIRHLVIGGDVAAVSLVLRGTHKGEWRGVAASGAAVEVEEMMFFRFDGDTVVEMWELFDEQTMRRQIGGGPGPV